ncbi:hypothetical protein UNSWDHB_761 [Dehalobacter sp. UNSWDHB]|jgi:hypothetical protein|uniref:hypothetical protein n=1 Tax=unclassified Dehalobacter TaxID=2635733 RepID=UPI00028ADE31|nr:MULTISPECIES: hypothetical protein [unclassified Dehalobacter]AFV01326.1 hypothetical protein DHBDCA_p298 [Dehalobacter sp. DCA]AFV04366.1 hypothetical protein DCF50_p360 [Dehalobacter sp. CF]EQB21914.1 hypothetical protein UNSWDHB_761 [Dehalobacter sp. UNSWDHB]
MKNTIILTCLFLLLLSGCSKNTPTTTQQTDSSTKASSSSLSSKTQPATPNNQNSQQLILSANLKDISASADFQYLNSKNQRKVNISVSNSSEYIFSGKVYVTYRDSDNKNQGTDTLLIKNLLPRSSTSLTSLAIANANRADFTINGDFTVNSSAKLTYTILYTQSEVKSQVLYIQPPSIDENVLTGIIREQRDQLSNSNLRKFKILFYDPSYKGQQGAQPAETDSVKAKADINYIDGISELYFIDSGKVVLIQ